MRAQIVTADNTVLSGRKVHNHPIPPFLDLNADLTLHKGYAVLYLHTTRTTYSLIDSPAMYYHAVDTIYPDYIPSFCVILQGQQGTAPLGLVSKVHAKDGGLVVLVAGALLHLL